MFAIGRNHPAMRDALKSVLDADLPNLVQIDVSTLAGILAERLLDARALSRQGVLRQFRRRMRRSRDQVRARRHRPAGHRLLRPRLSRPDLRRAVAQRRCDTSATASSRCCRIAPAIPFNDLAALEQALSSREVAAFIVEPIQGKGVNMPADELSAGRGRALPQIRHAVRRRRDPDRHRAAPAASSRSSTGTSSPTWCCWRRRCPAATCRSAPC